MSNMGKIHKNEDGLVAIIVATIIMIILSLVTLGFARLMQREQRQALDRGLSTQAFYAAESAVNDAAQQIRHNGYTANKTSCGTDATFTANGVGTGLNATYSCLLINQNPTTLEYTNYADANSIPAPLESSTGDDITSVKISWDNKYTAATTYPCPASFTSAFPAFSSWDPAAPQTYPGIMRVDLIPADTLNRAALVNNTITMYLYPVTAGCTGAVTAINNSAQVGDSAKGKIIPVACMTPTGSMPHACELTINNDSSPNKKYYVRLKSLYKSSAVTVRIFNAAIQLGFKGAQVQVDSTGKVADIVRRIQVRIAVDDTYYRPEGVIQSMDSICKQVSIAPGTPPIGTNNCGT